MTSINRASLACGQVFAFRKSVLLTALVALGAMFVFGASRWHDGHHIHEAIEWIGIALIFICIFGRSWCSLYIGGRKNSELVTLGPYSICRNPLYTFSIIGAVGVGAQLGSVTITLLTGLIAWLVFQMVIRHEEQVLLAAHDDSYRDYFGRVPRLLPRPSLWRNVDKIEISSSRVVMTFIDACIFLLAIPAAEAFEYLQDSGLIPVLLRLP